MKRILVTLALLAGTAPALHAQMMVVQPEKPLDAERAQIKHDLLQLRDTLQTVRAAGARFARDRSGSSDALARARVREMAEACSAADRALPAARRTVDESAKAPAAVRAAVAEQHRQHLLAEMDRLHTSLVWCGTEFRNLADSASVDEARYGAMSRAARVQKALDEYGAALDDYLRGRGIKVRPIGS